MATLEKLIDVKPITPHPYKANPSCLNCGNEATHDVLYDNGEVMLARKVCKGCIMASEGTLG